MKHGKMKSGKQILIEVILPRLFCGTNRGAQASRLPKKHLAVSVLLRIKEPATAATHGDGIIYHHRIVVD